MLLFFWTASILLMFLEVCGFQLAEAYSRWGRTRALYALSLAGCEHICRLRLHRLRIVVAFLVISSTWVLKVSLLSSITPRYLSEAIVSKMWVVGVGEDGLHVDMEYPNLITCLLFLVIRRILQFSMLKHICHLSAHF